MTKTNWIKIQEYANTESKGLLTLFADPKSDEIFISFNGQNAFVKFPFKDMSTGVVFNALRESKFKEAIDAFMTGVIEATGINTANADGNELLKTLGGGIKALGVEKDKIINDNKKSNAKSKNKSK